MSLIAIDSFGELTVKEASLETASWQKNNSLKAFVFHKNDINCLFQNRAALGIRFYMGLRACMNSRDEAIFVPDMMVVGVDSSGNDIISEEGISGVYNFALPCPRACDIESLLYHKEHSAKPQEVCAQTTSVTHSTEEVCRIREYSIDLNTAIERTGKWQTYSELKSVLFKKEDLSTIFDAYGVDALRVYFGFNQDGKHKVILVGAKENGKGVYIDQYESEDDYIYESELALCTTTNSTTCATGSPLCHGC